MRLVQEARKEDPELSLNQAVIRIGGRVGVNADTLRGWCNRPTSMPDGVRARPVMMPNASRDLEAENRELKRANEILLAASSFFARELDPRLPW